MGFGTFSSACLCHIVLINMSKFRKFIDIGANLLDPMYLGIYNDNKKHQPDLDCVLKRSWEAGLNKIIITAGNLDESRKAIQLSDTDERLYSTVGCHPTRCNEFLDDPNEYLSNLEQLIDENLHKGKIVAIGECGLDYDRLQFCSKETQKECFQLQLNLCRKFQLPLFLHCRNAADDLYEILKNSPKFEGVIHSYDGTIDDANKFIDLGYFIGINGCSLKTKENLETVKCLPKDRLLLETDCPWCEIRPSHAGYSFISKEHQFPSLVKKEKWKADSMVKNRNEPNNIRQVFDIVSGVREQIDDSNELCETIYNNTMKLFFLRE